MMYIRYYFLKPFPVSLFQSTFLVMLFCGIPQYEARVLNVALIGDSLLQKACCYYNLIGKILSRLPEYNINIYQIAVGGATVDRMVNRQLQTVIDLHPDLILCYWDSDVSDIDESIMTSSHINSTRAMFTKNLETILREVVLVAGIPLAIGGPGVIGEGPILRPEDEETFKPNKEAMLDEYQAIIRNVVAKYHNTFPSGQTAPVPYMDIRADLLGHMSHSWRKYGYYKCIVTEDGEHPNDLGATVIANRFAASTRDILSMGFTSLSHLNKTVATAEMMSPNQPQFCKSGYADISLASVGGDCAFQAVTVLAIFPMFALLAFYIIGVIKVSCTMNKNFVTMSLRHLHCLRYLGIKGKRDYFFSKQKVFVDSEEIEKPSTDT